MVAARQQAIFVPSLLNHGPFTRSVDDKCVQVELKAVRDGVIPRTAVTHPESFENAYPARTKINPEFARAGIPRAETKWIAEAGEQFRCPVMEDHVF